MKRNLIEPVLGFCLLGIVILAVKYGSIHVTGSTDAYIKEMPVVVIDAGHGGTDPGKVGVDGSLEKDINLAVAKRLKTYLEQDDIRVIMTRETDTGLYSDTDSRKKMADMKKRCEIIEESGADLVVSIHQNSLPSSKQTHGAQVFYGKKEGSAEVANAVQLALNQTVNAGNEKTEKAIDASIFLMKNVTAPAILIECGFLSNENETALLKSGEYQQRLAVVIASGLLQQ